MPEIHVGVAVAAHSVCVTVARLSIRSAQILGKVFLPLALSTRRSAPRHEDPSFPKRLAVNRETTDEHEAQPVAPPMNTEPHRTLDT